MPRTRPPSAMTSTSVIGAPAADCMDATGRARNLLVLPVRKIATLSPSCRSLRKARPADSIGRAS